MNDFTPRLHRTKHLPQPRSNFITKNRRFLVGPLPPKKGPGNIKDLLEYGVTHIVNLSQVDYVPPKGMKLLRLKISSGRPPPKKECLKLIDKLIKLYYKDDSYVIYIHCMGGHGRAGVIASLFLGKLLSIPGDVAIRMVEKARNSREDKSRNFIPTPETQSQVNFVCQILGVEKEIPDRSDISWLKKVKNERSMKSRN